jgi:hypothetical protein
MLRVHFHVLRTDIQQKSDRWKLGGYLHGPIIDDPGGSLLVETPETGSSGPDGTGLDYPIQTEDYIFSSDWDTVTPSRFVDAESIGRTIIGHLPTFGQVANYLVSLNRVALQQPVKPTTGGPEGTVRAASIMDIPESSVTNHDHGENAVTMLSPGYPLRPVY